MSEHQSQLAPADNKFHRGNGDDRLFHPQTGPAAMNRRGFLTGMGALLATSALVRPIAEPAAPIWAVNWEGYTSTLFPSSDALLAWDKLLGAEAAKFAEISFDNAANKVWIDGNGVLHYLGIPASEFFDPDSE